MSDTIPIDQLRKKILGNILYNRCKIDKNVSKKELATRLHTLQHNHYIFKQLNVTDLISMCELSFIDLNKPTQESMQENEECSYIDKAYIPHLSYEYKQLANTLKKEFKPFLELLAKSNLSIFNIKWKDIMKSSALNDTFKTKLYSFREHLKSYLNMICHQQYNIPSLFTKNCSSTPFTKSSSKTSCLSFGSTKLDSDIDITSTGDCMGQNLIVFKAIQQACLEVFSSLHFTLKNIYQLFDINFYLSNFAVLLSPSYPINKFSSYICTTDFYKQYKFALFEYNYTKYTDTNKEDISCIKDINYEYLALNVDVIKKEIFQLLTTSTTSLKIQQKKNEYIDTISEISGYEDQCYHTQGSFFHVVLMNQRNIEFEIDADEIEIAAHMFMCSCIENLCFARLHFDRKEKYIKRVTDALYRLDKILDNIIHLFHINKNSSIQVILQFLKCFISLNTRDLLQYSLKDYDQLINKIKSLIYTD